MKLTPFERLSLLNQYKILAALYPDDDYKLAIEALEHGYEIAYDWHGTHLTPENEVLRQEGCEEVMAILNMFRQLGYSYRDLSDKAGIDAARLKFGGFDGNNETSQMAFCRFLREEGKYGESLKEGDDFNSHMPQLDQYRAMLAVWQQVRHGADNLTADQIKKIVSAR